MNEKQHIITETMLDKIRNIRDYNNVNGKRINLTEDSNIDKSNVDKKNDAIAITNSPRFGQNVLQSQEDAFKNTVNNGTIFASENENDPTSNPLVFIPKNEKTNTSPNIIFSGTIPGMSNLKFQFKLNEPNGNGCFIWVDGLNLSEETVKTLNKIHGYYLNWRDQWNQDIDSLIKMYSESND